MDIKKVTLAAENGDVEAMVRLAEHWLPLRTENGERWAQAAGERQHTYGAYLATLCKKEKAHAACALDGNEALDALAEYHVWARRTYGLYMAGMAGGERVSEKEVISLCEEAAFERANRLYKEGKRNTAIMILRGEGSYNNCLLLGLCLWERYTEDEDSVEEDLLVACECLSEIVQIHTVDSSDDVNIEYIYTKCALIFSEIQRKGLWLCGIKPSPRAGVETLRKVRSVIKNKSFREMLSKELSNYEKILFGRYVYIGGGTQKETN